MYQMKQNEHFFQNFVLIGICALVLLGGCSPMPYPEELAGSSPLESPVATPVGGVAIDPERVLALVPEEAQKFELPPDSPEDMARLLAHAESFQCESDKGTLHCAANAPANEEGFEARVYVKVPDQGYPTDVVLLPIFPPAAEAEGERSVEEIRSLFEQELILQKPDRVTDEETGLETEFLPKWLITNFAVVKVNENGVFSGKVEDALSEFEPAIEVRLEFNRAQLERAAEIGLGMPRFGYWSYAHAPGDRKWVEFTPEREHDNRALLEIFQTDKAVTPAERGMADVGILEFIEEAATVDQALELLKQPSTRGIDDGGVRAVIIRDPTGLADKFDLLTNATTRGTGDAEARVSFVVTVSSWEDQALALFP